MLRALCNLSSSDLACLYFICTWAKVEFFTGHMVTTFCSIAHSLLLADILFLGTRVKLTMEVKAKRADN